MAKRVSPSLTKGEESYTTGVLRGGNCTKAVLLVVNGVASDGLSRRIVSCGPVSKMSGSSGQAVSQASSCQVFLNRRGLARPSPV